MMLYLLMQIDDALIDKLSRLCMLHFNENEKNEIKTDLEQMIGFVDKLKELNLETTEPLMFISGAANVLREDIAGDMLSQEEALKNASVHDNQFFLVPKVIKKDPS